MKRFQTDPSVKAALLGITACGVGVNLTSAALAVFVELNWDVGKIRQVPHSRRALWRTAILGPPLMRLMCADRRRIGSIGWGRKPRT
jgi:hypothetical protein